MLRWFFFVVLSSASWGLRVLGAGAVEDSAGSALLALGCLILGGILAGDLAACFRLPRVTGYLLLGMLAGPYSLGLETLSDARFLHLFEELALGLIALTAGGETELAAFRRNIRLIGGIIGSHLLMLPLAGAGLWILLGHSTAMGHLAGTELLAACALLGTIAIANSPSTTIAVITELKAGGPLTEAVLGVTILKDMVILLLFTWVNVMAHAWIEDSPIDLHLLGEVGLEIFVSLGVGILLGVLLGFYMRRVGLYLPLVVLALALVSVEMAAAFHLEHLLICMAAGFVLRNLFSGEAEAFIEALELSSPPVYIVFFALVGGGLDLGILSRMWFPAVVFVAIRLLLTWILTGVPARLSGAGKHIRGKAWMGFVAQAGLSLGLAARIQREMPGFGEKLALLIVAAVVINQLLGPVLWAHALKSSGEEGAAGRRNRGTAGIVEEPG